MKLRISAFLVALTMIFSFVFVSAEGDFNVSCAFKADTGEVIISGSGEGEIIITLLENSVSEDSLSVSKLPVDIFQINSKGEYEETIFMPDGLSGGKYKVIATGKGAKAQCSFIYINDEEAKGALGQIAECDKKSDFVKTAVENDSKLGVDVDDEFYKENKEDIFALMFSTGAKYEEPSDFYNAYYAAAALCKIGELDSKSDTFVEDAEKILSENDLYLGIDFSEDYADDSRLSEDARKEVIALLNGADFNNALKNEKPFSEYLEETKALAAVKKAEVWQDIKDALTKDFENIFEEMIEKDKYFSKIKTTQNVYSKMMKNTYSSFEDIENAFEDASYEVYKKEKGNTSSGGSTSGSGGGSYGGGGAVITTPQNPDNPLWTEPEVTNPEENEDVQTVGDKKELPELSTDAVVSFKDLDKAHWGYKSIAALNQAGIINGYEDGTFKPDGNITRAEFTKMIYSAFGLGDGNATFSDVSKDSWYYKYISSAAANEIIKGNNGFFRPDEKITRQDAAVIIYRAIYYRDVTISGNATFEDNAEIARYAYPAVGALKAYSIVKGRGSNQFVPGGNITRAEAAQMIFTSVNVCRSAQ